MLEDNAANLIDNYLQLQNYTALQLVFLLEIGIQTLWENRGRWKGHNYQESD